MILIYYYHLFLETVLKKEKRRMNFGIRTDKTKTILFRVI